RLILGERVADKLCGLSFSLRAGQIAILQAPNGWGKTTLLQSLSGILPIARGKIRLHGHDIQSLAPWARASLGLTHLQAQNHIFPNLTVAESLLLSAATAGGPLEADLSPLLRRRTSDLSGGEKQKVAFVCALQCRHSAVGLLDEPFSALDLASVRRSS